MTNNTVLKAAIVQMKSNEDPWSNLVLIDSFVQEAQNSGAELVCFPENALFRGPKLLRKEAILSAGSELALAIKEMRRHWRINVLLGSVLRPSLQPLRPYNSSWLMRPKSHDLIYTKLHLFKFHSKLAYDEHLDFTEGSEPCFFEQASFRFGLSICYDLRFPEMFRYLLKNFDTNVILVPSAFTQRTGRAHWHKLLMARAIENLSYVIAPAQWGAHKNDDGKDLLCYGHSLVVDPWGERLVDLGPEGDQMALFDLDAEFIAHCRSRLPNTQDSFFKLSLGQGPL